MDEAKSLSASASGDSDESRDKKGAVDEDEAPIIAPGNEGAEAQPFPQAHVTNLSSSLPSSS